MAFVPFKLTQNQNQLPAGDGGSGSVTKLALRRVALCSPGSTTAGLRGASPPRLRRPARPQPGRRDTQHGGPRLALTLFRCQIEILITLSLNLCVANEIDGTVERAHEQRGSAQPPRQRFLPRLLHAGFSKAREHRTPGTPSSGVQRRSRRRACSAQDWAGQRFPLTLQLGFELGMEAMTF